MRKVGHSSLRRYKFYQQFSTKRVGQVDTDFDMFQVINWLITRITPVGQIDMELRSFVSLDGPIIERTTINAWDLLVNYTARFFETVFPLYQMLTEYKNHNEEMNDLGK